MNVLSATQRYSKPLSNLLSELHDVGEKNDIVINSLCLDSRKVQSGSLFFAVPGTIQDGREYIDQAIRGGAGAVVYETDGWILDDQSEDRVFGVSNLRRHIGPVSDIFYNKPSSKFHVVGITGTNGKSSCAHLCAQALERLGHSCGLIGTLGSGFPGQLHEVSLTTPDPISLQQELAEFADKGANYVCLEVSSHSLDQSRNDGVRFGTVVFTNLTRDHLDYHGTEEHYRNSKSKLFTATNASSAVLNIDDSFGRELVETSVAQNIVTYGSDDGDIRLLDCVANIDGISVSIGIGEQTFQVESTLLGRVNAMNVLAAAAVLHALGFEVSDIERGLRCLEPVAGRMERISGSSSQPTVFVDYAHTPDGLENALKSLRELTKGQLWCVFGCGGSRDQEKRPMMGEIAERYADQVVITDDNPRDEDPQAIAQRITDGMKSISRIIHERGEAIRYAISHAGSEDTVLIAGKGHETTQTYRYEVRAFSDRESATEVLWGEA